MRIAIFTETFLPKIDGVVTRLQRTLEQLDALGHEVLLFAPARKGLPESFAGQTVVGIPSFPCWPVYPELRQSLPDPRILARLRRFGPDVVHLVNPFLLGLWGRLAAGSFGVPVLASFHTNVVDYVRHMGVSGLAVPFGCFTRKIHGSAHLNLSTSEAMVRQLEGFGVGRVRLWPMAVDTLRFHPDHASAAMRERLSGGRPEAPLAICVGRLSFEKRLDWLAAALPRVPGLQLALVGGGPAEGEVRKYYGGTDTVFTGFLGGDELAAAYASADFLVFPSDTETLGFGAMEALASGIPAVVADAGGLPEVVSDGETGLVFEPGNIGDLVEKMAVLAGDRPLRERMGRAARSAMEGHGWRAATESLVDRYRLAIRIAESSRRAG